MFEIYYLFTVIIILTLILRYLSRNVNFWKDRGVNGPKPLPLFGNLLDNFKTPINILEVNRTKKYGKIYGYFQLMRPVLSVGDAELIKLIAIKDFNCFQEHFKLAPGDPLMSKMLINMPHDDWKRVRSIASPAFKLAKIKQMFQKVDRYVGESLEYFEEVADTGKEIEMESTFLGFAMNVINPCAVGVESNSYKNPNNEFLQRAKELTDFRKLRVLVGLLLPQNIRKFLGFQIFNEHSIAFFSKLIKHIVFERRQISSQHNDFVKHLIDANSNESNDGSEKRNEGKIDESEIFGHCMNVIMCGYETTGAELMYLFYTLATKTEIQEKLYNELNEYFKRGTYDYDSLDSLKYLHGVISELLRRYPSVVQYDRVANCDYELGDTGINIPKGTIINMPFYAVHHDPDYWPEPFEFKPERFFPENKGEINPYTYMPFGIGPRMCIAHKFAMMQLKISVARLVHRFKIVRTANTPNEPLYNGKRLLLQCEPMFVKLERR